MTDILRELEKPGRDPRPGFTTAAFREGVERLADLAPGMVLEGVVTNVAAFGAFVDIGVHQDGLVHVSAMSRDFVSDPRQVAKPGDIVKVKVLSVDAGRKRISLSMRLDDEHGAAAGAGQDQKGPARGTGRSRPASGPTRLNGPRRDSRRPGGRQPGRDGRGAAPGGPDRARQGNWLMARPSPGGLHALGRRRRDVLLAGRDSAAGDGPVPRWSWDGLQ